MDINKYKNSTNDPKKIFGRAKKILLDDRWTKGQYQKLANNGRLSFCVLGACRYVSKDVGFPSVKITNLLERAIAKKKKKGYKSYYFDVAEWNDSKRRKVDDVVEVLDIAASLAERGE